MHRLLAASAAIAMCLTLAGVPCTAQGETESDCKRSSIPDDSEVVEWPSALELRRALSDIGWVWGAGSGPMWMMWTGGPPPPAGDSEGRAWLQEAEVVGVDEGQGVKVMGLLGGYLWVVPSEDWQLELRMREPRDDSAWPENVTSDWTMLAEVVSLLPIDGVTRFQIRRTLAEPSTMPAQFPVPGGLVLIEADDSPGYWASVRFRRTSPVDLGPTPSPEAP